MRSGKRGKRKNERTEIRQTLIEGETGKEEGNVWALDWPDFVRQKETVGLMLNQKKKKTKKRG